MNLIKGLKVLTRGSSTFSMGKLIGLGAFGGCIRDVMRPVDLLFRDLESVVLLFRITLMDAKIRNVGRGEGYFYYFVLWTGRHSPVRPLGGG